MVLENNFDNQSSVVYNVYAPNHYREKESCSDDLKEIIDIETISNIIVAGNLNLILHANEKRGGFFSPDPSRGHLEAIIRDHELVDVVPKNRKYTWSNRRLGNGNIMERLDRFLINLSFLSSFSTGYTSILSTSASDHYPITLTLETRCPLVLIPFRYNPLWNWDLAATARKLRNNVSSILDNEGNQLNTQEAIKRAATDHYRELLMETKGEEDYGDLLQYLPKEITREMNDSLTKEIEEEEIRRMIWFMNPDKAPGPDGFPVCFYKDFWGLIKKYLTKMIIWIQRKGKIGGYTNATFLALIPKENRPTSFSRFRPISLCNSSYKILSKILASRLKPLLPSLMSNSQGGFLANKQITHSILLVQEAIHSSLSRKEKGFILKLDPANAFDRFRHSFLIVVLKKMGFEFPFISLITVCIFGPFISPLVNGKPGKAFQSSQGLR
eukprot:PITA_36435